MKKIGIDLDNVVFDVQQEMIDIYNETHNPKITKKTWNKYYLRDVTGILLEEETQIFKIMDARGRFKNMNLLPHAKDCLTELSREYNIIPVTSRHKELTAKETLFCLKKNQIPFYKIVFEPDKQKIARQYGFAWFVEDHLDFAEQISKVCPCYLFDYPYNRNGNSNKPDNGIIRVPGFDKEDWWLNLLAMVEKNSVKQ